MNRLLDKPWVWPIALLVLVFAGDRGLASALEHLTLSSQQRYSLVYRGGQKNDILVLGDSRGVNGFYSPVIQERTGLRALNLSYNGMSTECAEAVLLDYLDHNSAPFLVVLEITNLGVESNLLTELKLFGGRSARIESLVALRYPQTHLATRVFHLFRFNGEMLLRALNYLRKSDQDWINRYRISPAILEAAARAPERSAASLPHNLASLQRIVADLKRRNIEVRLVISPYLPAYLPRIRDLDEWALKVEQELGGSVRVRNDASQLSDVALFADRLHLNEAGGRAYLDQLFDADFFNTSARLRSTP